MKLHFTYNMLYIALFLVFAFAGRQWLVEHDARLRAEDQERISEHVIEDLRGQMSQRQVVTEKQIQVVTRIVHEAKTPEQVVAAMPQLTDAPLNTRVIPGDVASVQVDAPALVAFAGQCKADAVALEACKADVRDLQGIADELTAEKKEWKKAAGKHGFFGKLWGGVQKVGLLGIGIAIGSVI